MTLLLFLLKHIQIMKSYDNNYYHLSNDCYLLDTVLYIYYF